MEIQVLRVYWVYWVISHDISTAAAAPTTDSSFGPENDAVIPVKLLHTAGPENDFKRLCGLEEFCRRSAGGDIPVGETVPALLPEPGDRDPAAIDELKFGIFPEKDDPENGLDEKSLIILRCQLSGPDLTEQKREDFFPFLFQCLEREGVIHTDPGLKSEAFFPMSGQERFKLVACNGAIQKNLRHLMFFFIHQFQSILQFPDPEFVGNGGLIFPETGQEAE